MGTTHQDIEINAPVNTVWQAIRDFHDMRGDARGMDVELGKE